jgi:hypothetical protein
VLGYLVWAWGRHGRDPQPGVIFPHYEPPTGYSPASARFIMRMGYDNRAFTAAVISLAVKGYLEIDAQGGKYTLHRRTSAQPLAAGEKTLLGALFTGGASVELDNKNHALLARAKLAHQRSLKRDYQKLYFLTNAGLLLPSLGATVALAIAIGLLGAFRPLVVAVLVLMVVVHLVFAWLLRAPTQRGRRLMDQLEGFRTYLEVAEKDELNLRNPPAKTPELFERYLPFALALGVEQKWAEKFAAVFARLGADGGRYQPAWYSGNFNARDLGGFTAGVGQVPDVRDFLRLDAARIELGRRRWGLLRRRGRRGRRRGLVVGGRQALSPSRSRRGSRRRARNNGPARAARCGGFPPAVRPAAGRAPGAAGGRSRPCPA